MILSITQVILFIVLAVIFLMGKGDMLIAGYNTASEEERQQVNIYRLRLLMAVVSVVTAAFCGALGFKDGMYSPYLTPAFLVIVFAILILANTWAKRK